MGRFLLDWLPWAVAVGAILHNCWALLNVAWSIRWLRSCAQRHYPLMATTKVVVCLPMFREATLASDTMSYFSRLDYPQDRFIVVAVTTSREDSDASETTAEVVQKWIRSRVDYGPQIVHLHLRGTESCKADQLNSALETLGVELSGWLTDDTFIAVYDADSRPDLGVLRELDAEVAENPDAKMFQQGALYFANYRQLPSGICGYYLRSRPFYNLRFCLYRELPGFARSVAVSKAMSGLLRALLSSPNHLIGHGEFVRYDAIMQCGGFPAPSGDTSIGTVLSYCGLAVHPLKTLDTCETPASIRMLFLQGITWYSGCSLYLRDMLLAWNLGAPLSLMQSIMCIRRWLENMIWCVGPLLLLAALSLAALEQRQWLAAACAASCGLHFTTVLTVGYFYDLHRKTVKGPQDLPQVMKPETVLMLLTAYPIMLLGTCLSPITYYFLWLRALMCGHPIPRPKTERVSCPTNTTPSDDLHDQSTVTCCTDASSDEIEGPSSHALE